MSEIVTNELREHEKLVWGLCYRMTGSAADADDLLQETYVRALERPPKNPEGARAWLVKVAVNLARDNLRRRRRETYRGPWLPSPAPDDLGEPASIEPVSPVSTEGRYDLFESASYAFLLALEALTPMQRAVLVLSEVLEYSTRETARALGISATNVKTTHHRARRILAERAREAGKIGGSADERLAKNRAALERFLAALLVGDADAIARVLADDAVSLHDTGGEFVAAGKVLVGGDRIAKAMVGIGRNAGPITGIELRVANGLVWLVADQPARPSTSENTQRDRKRTFATRWALAVCAREDGAITHVFLVLARKKLARIAPPVASPPK